MQNSSNDLINFMSGMTRNVSSLRQSARLYNIGTRVLRKTVSRQLAIIDLIKTCRAGINLCGLYNAYEISKDTVNTEETHIDDGGCHEWTAFIIYPGLRKFIDFVFVLVL